MDSVENTPETTSVEPVNTVDLLNEALETKEPKPLFTSIIHNDNFSPCRLIAICNYSDFKLRYVKEYHDVEDVKYFILKQNLTGRSVFEVIRTEEHKIFLDLEKIPVSQPDTYQEIIDNFMEFADLNKQKTGYVVTHNKGSSHQGLSYHVIFNVSITKFNLRCLVNQFKEHYPQYKDYVDSTIYTRNRLFRLPEQVGCNKTT